MPLSTTFTLKDVVLTDDQEQRIEHQLEALERRLVHHPEPSAALVLTAHATQRQIQADLRLQLGPLGLHLISHQSAETPDRAVHLAVEDLERQLERRLAQQRGEHAYGVPSRRLPKQLRPHPVETSTPAVEQEEKE